MESKKYILERICIFAEKDFNPTIDQDVVQLLRDKFNIYLPQRSALNESLESTASSHEIIELILKYRNFSN
ncbi:MAG: DNA polymerase I-like protein with 3'-5' exonuclease and polymerase domains [Oleispira sp.]|jgi:DNA polymerase I-like protein with 3'-5' exonuclease and polymerase domains